MSTINRVAKGILSLLDAKTGGQLPPDLAQYLQGTLEFTPFMLADLGIEGAQEVQSSSAANIGSSRAQVAVPAGQVWAVVGVSSTVVCPAAGGNFKICPTMSAPGSALGDVNMKDQNNSYTMLVGESTISALVLTPPLLVGSGTVFGTRIVNGFAAAANVFTDISFYRLLS